MCINHFTECLALTLTELWLGFWSVYRLAAVNSGNPDVTYCYHIHGIYIHNIFLT